MRIVKTNKKHPMILMKTRIITNQKNLRKCRWLTNWFLENEFSVSKKRMYFQFYSKKWRLLWQKWRIWREKWRLFWASLHRQLFDILFVDGKSEGVKAIFNINFSGKRKKSGESWIFSRYFLVRKYILWVAKVYTLATQSPMFESSKLY